MMELNKDPISWERSELTRESLRISQILALVMAVVAASRSIRFVMGTISGVEYAGGNTNWTGVSGVVLLTTASIATFWFGKFTSRFGYRKLLAGACLWGTLSSLVGFWSSLNDGSLVILLTSFLLTGVAHGLLPMSRYAAAEAAESHKKSRAMGLVIFGAAIGSTLGPLGLDFSGKLAIKMGMTVYNGAWLLEAVIFLLAWVAIVIGLRTEPAVVAKAIRTFEGLSDKARETPATTTGFSPAVWSVIGVMLFSQVAMVLVMSITPIHLKHGGHGMGAVAWTISAHMFGMFGLSYPVGWLADRAGTRSTAWGGVILLGAACLATLVSRSTLPMVVGLFLLGLGWNACFIAGSRMISEVSPPGVVHKVQGLNESIMLVASGAAVLGSGFLYTYAGFQFMCGTGITATILTGVCLAFFRK